MNKIVIVFLFLGMSFININAETLTLDQAVAEALKMNLSLQQDGIKTLVKKRDKEESLNKLYPSITAAAAEAHLNDTTTTQVAVAANPSTGQLIKYTPDATYLAFSLSAQFTLSYSTILAIKQTSIDYGNAKISYETAKQNLARDVKKLFYQLLVAEQQIELTKRQLDNAEERYRQAKSNFSAGLAPELTVLQAQVTWENRKPYLDDLKVNYYQALFNFENLLGREPKEDLSLEGSLDVKVPETLPSTETLIDNFLDRRLDVQSVKGQIDTLKNYKEIQDSLSFPVLNIIYGYDPAINNPWDSKTDWKKSSNWVQAYSAATGAGALTVSLAWKLDSLIPTSQTNMQQKDAQDQLNQAQLSLAQINLSARTQISTLVKKLHKSIEAFKSLEQNEVVAQKAYRLTLEAYNTGARSLLEVQDAELQYQSAQLSLLNEKQVYISTLLDLETALNIPQEEIYGIKK